MRLVLVPAQLAVLLLALSGCADQEPGTQPARQPTSVQLVHRAAVGGERLGRELRTLDTAAQRSRFVRAFAPAFRSELRRAMADFEVPDAYELQGGIAYVGCGVPDDARLVDNRLVPGETHDENKDCLVAETTVGLVAVPMPAQ
jgi:hypothetical protein